MQVERPPGPRGAFAVGNLRAYEEDRLGFLLRLRQDYGAMASFDPRTTVISDLSVADRVLRDSDGVFEIPQNVLGHRLGEQDLATILETRILLSPELRARALVGIQNAVASRTQHRLERVGGDWFDPLTLAEDVIPAEVGRLFFGDDGPSLEHDVASLLDALEVVIGNVFALPASWKSPAQRRIERRHRRLRDKVSAIIVRRRQHPKNDIASLVVGKNSGHELTALADMLIGSVLAAQRVPAAAAGWILMLVADHPALQSQLRDEAEGLLVAHAAGLDPSPTAFPLALGTVLEALRLYPPTWLITRTSSRRVSIRGYEFPARHNFLVSPYVLHRDPSAWPLPDDFLPERWGRDKPRPGAFLAFGRGRHRCPGQDLTTNCLVALLLATVSQGEIVRGGTPVVPDPRITLKPEGLRVAVRNVGQVGASRPLAANVRS